MKRKNAFTLIELLAVIVVLAIIALIATPIVMNTIKKSKKGAAERSADNYIKQVETAVAEERLNKNEVLEGEYQITSDGNLCRDKSASCSDEEKIKIEISGNKPTSGTVTISNDGVSQDEVRLIVGDYKVIYNQEKNKYEATDKEKYKNGEVVYFNVDNGTKCTSSEAVSATGTKSGCMKFYAFNDDGGDTLNLMLDHNTTSLVAWNKTYKNDSGSIINANGPKEVLDQLKNDTDGWKGTITPTNYTMDQTGQTSNAKYTIDYSSYKARLITAQELAQITGNTTWDEKTANNYYYLDSKTKTASATCKEGNTSGCSYGWLYDRTNTSCIDRGCLNNSDKGTFGYWTASSRADSSNSAWAVRFYAIVDSDYVVYSGYGGLRPVITILKSKLS
jgi:type IV pilus assembly protein PilA